jgi:subtilisin family serine protease
MGAKIISNSWGGGGYSKLLEEAIQDAHAKGVLVVAAAGNYSNDNDLSPLYPANYEGVIAVASTDENDDLSSFSDFGKKTVMIAAPGSRIYSTVLPNHYGILSGTSMACPQVSGALALALAQSPDMSALQLKEKLCSSSKQILLDYVKCGRMDVGRLLE